MDKLNAVHATVLANGKNPLTQEGVPVRERMRQLSLF